MCDGGDNSPVARIRILRPIMWQTARDLSESRNPDARPVAGRRPPGRLGRYEVLHEIGRGAMGVVYRARAPVINREVALKTIPLATEFEGQELEEARAKFFREAETAGRLSHPNIVTIFDAGEHDGTAYIAMELLRGCHLVDHTSAARLLPPAIAIEVAARLAEGLHYAHRQGVVHRDMKPANVMFDAPSGELKITDFGIARLTDTGRTRTGIVLGTPSFMSPEQLQGRAVTGRSDLFSLAVTLFQLLTAQLPFRADSMPALMLAIAHEPPPPIGVLRPGLAPGLQAFFDRALAKVPEDRYDSGAEFATALRDLNSPGRA
jgi:serine/threonine-protein kinase